MQRFGVGKKEMEFARLLWKTGEIRSGALVCLCAEKFKWKKSTTYTILRRLCERGLFQNVNSIVTPLMTEEEYVVSVAEAILNDKFDGSLPLFMEIVTRQYKLPEEDRKKLIEIIEAVTPTD